MKNIENNERLIELSKEISKILEKNCNPYISISINADCIKLVETTAFTPTRDLYENV